MSAGALTSSSDRMIERLKKYESEAYKVYETDILNAGVILKLGTEILCKTCGFDSQNGHFWGTLQAKKFDVEDVLASISNAIHDVHNRNRVSGIALITVVAMFVLGFAFSSTPYIIVNTIFFLTFGVAAYSHTKLAKLSRQYHALNAQKAIYTTILQCKKDCISKLNNADSQVVQAAEEELRKYTQELMRGVKQHALENHK